LSSKIELEMDYFCQGLGVFDQLVCTAARVGVCYAVVYGVLTYVTNFWRLRKSCSSAAANEEKLSLKGKHVVITGGSSGIGMEVAVEVAKRGADISLLARSPQKLSEAAEYIKSKVPGTRCKIIEISVDLSSGYENVERGVAEAVSKLGPVYMLVNCAGFAVCRQLENLSLDDEQRLMNLNYFGSVWATRAALPSMKSRGGGGVIVYVGSQASLIGLYGMTGYCGSKFAIRGFAEAIAMEVAPFNIKVTVNCPPDTETPGLEAEMAGKPEETVLISQFGGLFKPQAIAKQLVLDALGGVFLGTSGLDGWIAVKLCSGLVNNGLWEVLMESVVMGPARLISWLYTLQFYAIVHKCHNKRNKDKKSE